MNRLNWKKDLNDAVNEITGGTRLLLMFFYHPECQSSIKTMNETFNDDNVINAIERETAPIMFNMAEKPELAREHRIDWTPTFIIADERGRELERWVGYLPPKEFIAQLTLSRGLAAFHLERFVEAIREFEMVIDDHPDSELVPEAEYFLGAANFKLTGESDKLSQVCSILMTSHPDSLWTKRCSIWSRTGWKHPFIGYDGGGSAGSGAY
ncbi:MAG: thioredoxin fold domain-containing protein [Deltaproteobacteria bacterium]|nr:thioredoxin fold domain-containing protein [Deltaproteobacteria bacterium]